MKKTITLLSLLFFVGAAFSQSLQFNQVKLVTSNETVPADKVWKVTGFIPSDATNIFRLSSAPNNYAISVNGTSRAVGHSAWYYDASRTGYASASFLPLPLWFPEGTVLNPSVSGSNLYGMSVIEFNVIP